MANLKPQVPMMSGGDYIYPVTTIDQILLEDGTRASVKNPIIDMIYPVGSIYMSVNAVSPSTLFGGTWERIQDTFLLAAGSSYAAGSTGGEAQHTLTVAEMTSHNHSAVYVDGNANYEILYGAGTNYTTNAGYISESGRSSGAYQIKTRYEGGSQPHNNMPPYLAVYMWQRIA